jgi:hypothetical protein
MRYILSLLALVVSIGTAGAQQAVQQTPTRLDAATAVAFGQAAVATASVATIVVPGGQYAYITAISIDACEDATAVALTNVNVTTAGIAGTPSYTFSYPATVNQCPVALRETFAVPLKSIQPGTNVVFTSPSSTHVQYTIRVYYYLAP